MRLCHFKQKGKMLTWFLFSQYIYFGSGQFDGQGSGHDYYGTLFMPPTGFVNNCDGGRSHTYCDYRQE